jgi:hypothetical protein
MSVILRNIETGEEQQYIGCWKNNSREIAITAHQGHMITDDAEFDAPRYVYDKASEEEYEVYTLPEEWEIV